MGHTEEHAALEFAREHIDVLMVGYTHLQPAQLIRFGHWLMSHMAALMQVAERLRELIPRVNHCPLGSESLDGNAFVVDREFLSRELGFEGVTSNSLNSVCNLRHSLILSHLSQLVECLIVNNMLECVNMDDVYPTGSSLMTQKKNPGTLLSSSRRRPAWR